MLHTLSLVLPVLLPSWRFFQSVEPSPRVQWALLDGGTPLDWQAFRPRPAALSPLQMLCRLFWNPHGNEALFVVSCAERIAQDPTPHSIAEIASRIQDDIAAMPLRPDRRMQFRLVFVTRDADGWSEEIVYLSPPLPARRPRNDV